ncbi:MAG: 23S rRNA (pseudouridine(1915)-N(3))-methyltransferase RlmH [Hyphomicrobiaceae bacterium]
MKLAIAAVGRLKDGPERELLDRYMKRLAQTGRGLGLAPAEVLETPEGRAETAALRQSDEAARLLKITASYDVLIALDETGRTMTSRAFAALIAKYRDGGTQGLALVIGGADGHGEAVITKAAVKLSLGAMTLPHGLARIVLAEQLYRATTILAGHPYHRD